MLKAKIPTLAAPLLLSFGATAVPACDKPNPEEVVEAYCMKAKECFSEEEIAYYEEYNNMGFTPYCTAQNMMYLDAYAADYGDDCLDAIARLMSCVAEATSCFGFEITVDPDATTNAPCPNARMEAVEVCGLTGMMTTAE